jgi:hypothetical protein
VTVSVVNDPIMENATGKIVVTAVEDDTGTDDGQITVDGTNTYILFSDPYIPPNAYGLNVSFAPSNVYGGNVYHIVGFSSAGILVDEDRDIANTPVSPTEEPYFVISSVNLGVDPGAQLSFSRYGEFDGVLGSGVPAGGSAALFLDDFSWAQGWNGSPDYVRDVVATATDPSGGADYVGFGYDHVVMAVGEATPSGPNFANSTPDSRFRNGGGLYRRGAERSGRHR